MNTTSLRSFRLVCKPQAIASVEALLHSEGFAFEEEPFSPFARRLTEEPFPLGASLAAFFGYIYIQDRSSMLPPLALLGQGPMQGQAVSVLDMCASPGSKTGFLAQLAGPASFILANEPSRARLATLRMNLSSLNLMQCATLSSPGESLPLPSAAEPFGSRILSSQGADGSGGQMYREGKTANGWEYIQLDPPCSGWGTVSKNPKVMELWQGDKVQPLIVLQRQLLREAMRLLTPGGKVVYSTCTTNIQENEEQILFATQELGYSLTEIAPPQGFSFAEPFHKNCQGTLRVATGEDGQGFFIAALTKPKEATPVQPYVEEQTKKPSFFPQDDKNGGAATGFSEQRKPQGKKNRRYERPAFTFLHPSSLSESAWNDISQLPAGKLLEVNNTVHFLPEASQGLLPEPSDDPAVHLPWKGFSIGKALPGGTVKLAASFRALMPDLSTACQRGLDCMVVESPEHIRKLMSGQSVMVGAKTNEVGLYFNDLPLCKLSVKGTRAIMPAR